MTKPGRLWVTLLVLILALPGAVFAGEWPSLRRDGTNRNSNLDQPELPLQLQGSFPTSFVSPVIQGDIAVTAELVGTTRYIAAYRLSTLEQLWTFSIGTNSPKQLSIYRGTVYFGLANGPTVYSLSLTTGTKNWQLALPGDTTPIRFAPLVVDDDIFVVSGGLHKITRDGQPLWRKVYNISSPLASDGSYLYFRVHDLKVIKFDIMTDTQAWAYTTNTTAGTEPLLTADTVYAGTLQKIIAINKDTGLKRWEFDTGASRPTIGNVALVGRRIIFSTNFGDITAVDENGLSLWTNRFNTDSNNGNGWLAPFIVAGDRILAKANQNEQVILSAIDGAQAFRGMLTNAGAFKAVGSNKVLISDTATTYIFDATSWTTGTLGDPPGTKRIDPVVIVPGILESWPVNGVWKLDPVFKTFDNLLASLREAGYVDKSTLFTFPYDWHVSNVTTGELLREKIGAIRAQTGASKVDIVAHSMGGLVTRSYIQGDTYANDVDEFIMLGTPNHGSVKAYLTWEAGETGREQIDIVKEKFLRYEARKEGYGSIIPYIHEKTSATRDLLPIFDYLEKDGVLLPYAPCSEISYPCNPLLDSLTSTKERLLARSNILNIIGQTDVSFTLERLKVSDSTESGLWQHGMPLNYPSGEGMIFGKGDGTVLTKSAHIDGAEETILKTDHTSIVSDAAQEVVRRLANKNVGLRVITSPSRYAFLKVYSPIDILLTDSQGRRIGTDSTGSLLNEIPEAFYSGNLTDLEYIIIPEPENVNFLVTVQGTGEGPYEIENSLISDNPSIDTSQTGTIIVNQIVNYTLSIRENGTDISPIPSPSPSPSPIVSPSPSPTAMLSPSPIPSCHNKGYYIAMSKIPEHVKDKIKCNEKDTK